MNEIEIQQIQTDCRRAYNEHGDLTNLYIHGSTEWAAWNIEVKKIMNEESRSR